MRITKLKNWRRCAGSTILFYNNSHRPMFKNHSYNDTRQLWCQKSYNPHQSNSPSTIQKYQSGITSHEQYLITTRFACSRDRPACVIATGDPRTACNLWPPSTASRVMSHRRPLFASGFFSLRESFIHRLMKVNLNVPLFNQLLWFDKKSSESYG